MALTGQRYGAFYDKNPNAIKNIKKSLIFTIIAQAIIIVLAVTSIFAKTNVFLEDDIYGWIYDKGGNTLGLKGVGWTYSVLEIIGLMFKGTVMYDGGLGFLRSALWIAGLLVPFFVVIFVSLKMVRSIKKLKLVDSERVQYYSDFVAMISAGRKFKAKDRALLSQAIGLVWTVIFCIFNVIVEISEWTNFTKGEFGLGPVVGKIVILVIFGVLLIAWFALQIKAVALKKDVFNKVWKYENAYKQKLKEEAQSK